MAKKPPTEYRWFYADINNDLWLGGAQTREAAIEDAKADELVSKSQFRIGYGELSSGVRTMPHARSLISGIEQNAADDFGEASDGFPNLTESAVDELERALQRWAKKWLDRPFWNIVKTERINGGD